MPTSNAFFRLTVRLQALIHQLPFASRFQQVGESQSTHKEKRWRLHPQQLHLVILALTVTFLGHETVQAQNAPTVVSVSPMSLVFAAEQGGANPAKQTLNVSTAQGQDLTWTVSKAASWLTLNPITENKATPVTASVTTGSLSAETYRDVITLAIAGTEAAKIPVTFVVTQPKGAGPSAPPQNTSKEEEEFMITNLKEQCLKDLRTEPVAAGDFGNHISFGPTIAAKAFNYDLASKQVTFNAGLGAGISMRYYGKVRFYDEKGEETGESYGIRHIRKKCRAETFDGAWLKPDNKKVAPWVSITPIVFASKTERDNEIQVQPALTVGFLGELINVGAGFNLSGQDKGHVFLLLSIGYGFKF